MKNTLKALVLVLALCLVLTGCQYLPEIPGLSQNPEHVHTLIHNEAKAPTCVNNGILEHWYCPGCNARFSDEAATNEVTFADLEVEETGHVAGADDGDCTTAVDCTVCGKVATPAAKAHTPEEDDGDCTTNVMCTQCAKIAIPGKAEHEANEDDGDCTTAVTCKHCDHVFVPAAEAHEAGEDDGDCTTAVKCANCEKNAVEAAEAHTPGAAATCTAAQTCTVCGTELAPIANHIDTNLDITCDFEGCTKRILPPADSKISLFTANHMIIVSLSSSYYVEGVVTEITDVKNGFFIITDEAGDTLLVRLPKNADGASYTNWGYRVVLGDTIRVYGKPSKNTGSPATVKAKIESGQVTVLDHKHSFSEPTCTKDGVCGCLAISDTALGHTDTDKDNLCDRCQWNMKLDVTNIAISTDGTTNGVLDANKTSWTWGNDDFDVVIAKGNSTFTLYTNAKAYMQLKKLNTLTVSSKNGASIYSITISATNASQLGYLKNAIGTAYEYTENAEELSVTIIWNSSENFVLTNNGTSTVYVNNVKIAYEKPVTTPDPENFVMADYVVSGELGGGAAVRQLGENITFSISAGWISNDTARVYQSAHAIIQSNFALSSIVINAGYKDSTFDVYVSEDGENWVLYGNYAYTSAYSDVTINFDAPTQYVKLDAPNKQLRMKTISVVYA